MRVRTCCNCGVTYIGAVGPDDDALIQAFRAHMVAHTIASPGAPITGLAAPLPTSPARQSVERGMIASRATATGDGADDPFPAKKMRHPSARLAAIVPMFGGAA